MEAKQLSRRQARYLDFFIEFNFQIIFREGKRNVKADALTRTANDFFTGDADERARQQYQTILTPERIEIRLGELEQALFDRVVLANTTDPKCLEFYRAVQDGIDKLHGVSLRDYRLVDGVLFAKGLL